MLTLLAVGCALLGCAIGSFLNVVIYRVPRGESVVSPRSACPKCGNTIRETDNVPILSWMLLRGRCRSCDEHIAVRYPLVEASCGALFAGAAVRFGYSWTLPAFLAFCAGLLALACIDAEYLLLPKGVLYPVLVGVAALLTIAAGLTGEWHRLLVAGACATGWFVVFFALNAVTPRLLGFGDVRLGPLLGLGLGWLGVRYALLGFFAANFIGAAIGIGLIASKRSDRSQPLPYGVFLALGAGVAIFAGPELLRPFQTLG